VSGFYALAKYLEKTEEIKIPGIEINKNTYELMRKAS